MRIAIFLLLIATLFLGCEEKQTEVKTDSKPLSASVEMLAKRPSIFINGEAHSSVIYSLTDMPGGRWTWEELPQHNLKVFCEKGVRMYQLDISFEQMWKEDGSLDVSIAQKQIRGLLEVCPDAAVFFRLHVNAPYWWQDAHREELVVYADTIALPNIDYGLQSPLLDDPRPVERISLASKKWLQQSSKMTALFCKKLAETTEGNAVIGIQVACGVFGEWHYWGFSQNEPDLSPPMTKHFQDWARQKYKSQDQLKEAWQNPTIEFDKIKVPDVEGRKTTQGIFRSPKAEQYQIDYYRCQHELIASHIIHFCKIVKENWSRPIITGTFYGYFFSVFGREVAGGHLEVRKVLESEYVDYLSAPQCYVPNARNFGEVYRSRGLLNSCLLNGKLWLDEMDVETDLPYHRINSFPIYVSRARSITRRNMIYSLLKGMGLWFYDYGISGVDFNDFSPKYQPSQGWWDHPAIMEDIQKIKEIIDQRVADKVDYTTDADVLFVFDTESCYYTASLAGKNPVTGASVDWGSLASFRSGVVFDAIHLADLEKVNLEQYKVVVFGNTYKLDAVQQAYIKNKIATNNRHLIWMYAPAYVDGKSLNLNKVSEMVGIRLKTTKLKESVIVSLEKEPAVFLTDKTKFDYQVSKKPFAPAFVVEDKEATPLAYYKENQKVALAYKEFDDYTSWYIGAPAKEEKSNIMRYILSKTKAHRYVDDPDAVVYAGWGMLFYYTINGEAGRERSVILKNGKKVTFTLPNIGSGVLLDAKTGKLILEAK